MGVPSGWIIDREGRPTTDPKAVAAVLPFGSYKGSGVALTVEIIGGILSGAGASTRPDSGNGVFMMAIDVAKFCPVKEFKEKVDRLVRTVKGSRKASGVEEILVAGEPEYKKMERYSREGIEVEDTTWEALKQTARELNVNIGEVVRSGT